MYSLSSLLYQKAADDYVALLRHLIDRVRARLSVVTAMLGCAVICSAPDHPWGEYQWMHAVWRKIHGLRMAM